MNNITTYLLKFFLCSGIFFLFYQIVLGRLKCFKFNRFYLLFSILFSMAIPLLTVPEFSKNQAVKPNIEEKITYFFANKNTAAEKNFQTPHTKNTTSITATTLKNIDDINTLKSDIHAFDIFTILRLSYLIICVVMMARFLWNLIAMAKLIYKNEKLKSESYTFVLLENIASPFTFCHYIFVEKNSFLQKKIPNQVIIHEQQHANEYHTFDILFVHFILAFGWINPVLFLYKNAILDNHEFLADNAVLRKNNNKRQYQHLLLDWQCVNNKIHSQLSNSFHFLTIKKRLDMMNRKNNLTKNVIFATLSFPLLFMSILVFAQRNEKNVKQNIKSTKKQKPYIDSLLANKCISTEEFNFYIAEMKKGNYKFDPKNRNRDWLSDLKNSDEGDSLIALYKKMTWQQKSSTNTIMPYEVMDMDSLSDEDWDLYNKTVSSLLSDQQKKKQNKLTHIKYTNTDAKSRIYNNPICLNDKYIKNYSYINLMLHYMSQNQINKTPYIVFVPIRY